MHTGHKELLSAQLIRDTASLTASLSTLFIEIYGLSEWQAGLIYLPFALGGTASTLCSGQLLDKAYSKARKQCGLPTDLIRGDDLDNFPIEKARLNVMWIPMFLITLCTVAYGWVLQYEQVYASEFLQAGLARATDKLSAAAYRNIHGTSICHGHGPAGQFQCKTSIVSRLSIMGQLKL